MNGHIDISHGELRERYAIRVEHSPPDASNKQSYKRLINFLLGDEALFDGIDQRSIFITAGQVRPRLYGGSSGSRNRVSILVPFIYVGNGSGSLTTYP